MKKLIVKWAIPTIVSSLCLGLAILTHSIPGYALGIESILLLYLAHHYLSVNNVLERTISNQNNILKHRDLLIKGILPENITQDRTMLLLLMAKTFKKAGKLLLEKKHPGAKNIILVFQCNNGNIRFSIPEDTLPDYLAGTVLINNSKINYNINYKLLEEIIYKE